MGLLSLLTFTPLLTAILIGFVPAEFGKLIKAIAALGAVITLVMACVMIGGFDARDFHFQMMESANWIPALGIKYQLGVDGISLWMVALTALLGVVAVGFSFYQDKRVKAFMVLLLLLETSMLGTFLALDMILFYTFFEVALFPMAFLIWIWGDENRNLAAIRFFIYLFGGSILMLVGMIALAKLNQNASGVLSFSIVDIQENVANGRLWAGAVGSEPLIFWAFALAFLIKSPAFPFHTWLVDSYTQAPIGAVLLGVLVKTGTYGLIRFCLPLFPEVLPHATPVIMTLAVIGILYGAVVAAVQSDIKRLIAFSSVSHVGFVILGIFSLSYNGILGGVLGGVSHGVATGSLILLVGLLMLRRNSRTVNDFGGLKRQMPLFAALFLISTLAAVGLPGTSAFVGEFLALLGTFESGAAKVASLGYGYVAVAAVGVILAAVYMLILFQKLFYGEVTRPEVRRLKDLKSWEVQLACVLLLFVLWGGIYPSTFTKSMEASVNASRMMGMNSVEGRPSWANPTDQIGPRLDFTSVQYGEIPSDLHYSGEFKTGELTHAHPMILKAAAP